MSSCLNVANLLGGKDYDTKLFNGIKYENLEMIKEAIEDGADINKINGTLIPDPNPLSIAYEHEVYRHDAVPEFLISLGADVNYINSGGSSLLIWMASNTNIHNCEFLINHGAKINKENKKGYTALESVLDNMGIASATEKNIDSIITLLLDHGAKIRPITLKAALAGGSTYITPKQGVQKRILEGIIKENYQSELDPPLEAAMLGQSSKLNEFIKTNKIKKEDEQQILFFTAAYGSLETIKLLETKGVDLNQKDKFWYTPLIIASHYGNLEVVKYLLSRGSDIEVRTDNMHKAALNYAVENEQYDTAEYLIKKGANIKPFALSTGGYIDVLLEASESGNVKIIKMLLSNGYPINDKILWQAAQTALDNGHLEALEFYLDKGVDIHKEYDGYGYFIPALSDLNDIKFLLAHGVNIDGTKGYGEFIKTAAADGNIKNLEYLIKNGANVNAIGFYEGKKSYSALMNAIKYGNYDAVELLVESGADLEYQCDYSDKDTAIITAAGFESRHILEYLIKSGANINYQNINGETALMRAVLVGCLDNVKILINNGAEKSIKDKSGYTALDYAKEKKLKYIIKYLQNKK